MPEQQPEMSLSAREAERQKWDSYYDSLPLSQEDAATGQFNEQFVERISALLAPRSEVLEAGCGAGWQSVALARSGRFEVSVMDFSSKALDHCRRVFERESLTAHFLQGDIRDPGVPAFDLVFNAGVLEHYTLEEQADLLRCMASRSRRYVLVLVPNALCYWYWLWRVNKAATGDWPFGKEVPLTDLSAAFRAAGLHFCGQVFLGQSWSELFIQELPGMDPALREQILRIHRAALIPEAQRSYLVAALGSVSAVDAAPQGWNPPSPPENMWSAEIRAILADSLAGRIGAETQLEQERRRFELTLHAERQTAASALQKEQEKWNLLLRTELIAAESLRRRTFQGVHEFRATLEHQIATYRSERAWRIMLAVRKAYTLLVRRKFRGILPFFRWSIGSALGSRDHTNLDEFEPAFANVLNYVPEELSLPRMEPPPPMPRPAVQIPKADGHYDIIVLPIFDFDFRFQRPQQIAMQFARAGHRVFWISPFRMLPHSSPQSYELIQIRDNIWETRLQASPLDLYRGVLEPSQQASLMTDFDRLYNDLDLGASCVIIQFPFWRQIGLELRKNFGARVVYDCMDDWQNWTTEPLPGAFSLAEEKKLVREADVLVVSSSGLRDRHAADGIEARLIRNAADFDFFRDAPASSLLSDLPRPVVGYYGAIADWFDFELMAEVARSRPQYSFVLIGQVHLSDTSSLESLPNIHLLGEKEYGELPAYLSRFDVCILPFRMNRLTEAVDPVKVYEYFCQGKPVVSVPLLELAPLSELLYFAAGPEEFSSQIDSALAGSDGALRQKRIAFASENTWRLRFETLDGAIQAAFPMVSLLVVTYNTREYLKPFFDSVRRNTSYPSYEVVVVDNHSKDGSAEELKRWAQTDPRIRVHCLEENLGFAGGNNFAARMAKGEYLVLLNPDTILTAGWLERLIRPLEKDPATGLVAPVSNFSGNETKINTGYRSLGEMDEFAAQCAQVRRGESFVIDVIPLFCGLLRRKLWDEIGGLDVNFKIGMFEDDDFSLRVRKAGYRIVTAEDCFIHHFGNGSFGKLESEEFLRIFNQNKKRFESKWNITWRPHRTRPGVRPVSAEARITLAKFLAGDGASGS